MHIQRRQRDDQRNRFAETAAGIEIRRQRHRHAGVDHGSRPGIRFAQAKRRRRQQYGNHAGFRHPADSFIRCVQQMFGGYRTHLGGQLRPAERNDLVGVDFGLQSELLGFPQQASGLVDGKNAFFAKHVAKFRRTVGSNPGQYFVQQVLHILVGPPFIFRRHGVRPHEGRRHFHDMLPVELRHDRQLLAFRCRVQSVAALTFHRRHAERQHGTQPLPADVRQFLRRSLAGGPYRIDDPAAPLHDLHVGIAAQPPGKFFFPVTGEQKMRVRIDKPRQYAAAGGIDHFGVRCIQASQHFRRGSHPADNAVLDPQRAIGDNADIRHRRPGFGAGSAASDQFGSILEQQFSGHSLQPPR